MLVVTLQYLLHKQLKMNVKYVAFALRLEGAESDLRYICGEV